MTTYYGNNFLGDTSVVANYQLINGTFDQQLTTLGGWFYTASAGDCIPFSASVPAVGVYNQNYRVYYTFVSGTTWFFRVGFGRTSLGHSNVYQLGSIMDASGNLSGQTSTILTSSFASSLTATTCSMWMSQTGGRLTFLFGTLTNLNTILGVGIHGCVDSSGSYRDGIEVYFYNQNSPNAQYIPVSGTVSPAFVHWPGIFLNQNSVTIGSTVMLSVPYTFNDVRTNNPTPGVVTFATADLYNGGALIYVPIYTSSRVYMTTPTTNALFNGNWAAAWLFE